MITRNYIYVFFLGFMPNLNARLGHRYSVNASEGLADFERQQLKNKAALNHLKKVRALHDGYAEPRTLEDRQVNFFFIVLIVLFIYSPRSKIYSGVYLNIKTPN